MHRVLTHGDTVDLPGQASEALIKQLGIPRSRDSSRERSEPDAHNSSRSKSAPGILQADIGRRKTMHIAKYKSRI